MFPCLNSTCLCLMTQLKSFTINPNLTYQFSHNKEALGTSSHKVAVHCGKELLMGDLHHVGHQSICARGMHEPNERPDAGEEREK